MDVELDSRSNNIITSERKVSRREFAYTTFKQTKTLIFGFRGPSALRKKTYIHVPSTCIFCFCFIISHGQTTKVFLPNMLEQGKGHIVNMSSMLGWAGLNGASDYCASKFAASGFSGG